MGQLAPEAPDREISSFLILLKVADPLGSPASCLTVLFFQPLACIDFCGDSSDLKTDLVPPRLTLYCCLSSGCLSLTH